MHDLRWFSKFMHHLNGVARNNHKVIDHTIELDVYFMGLGGYNGNYVYALSIPVGYMNLTIVHLEMLNVFLALRVFCAHGH